MAQSLTEWAQSHLTTLYESHPTTSAPATESDLSPAFDSAFSPEAEIFVNHDAVDRDALKDSIAKKKWAVQRCDVEWKNVIEVPANTNKPHEAGIVAGFLVVTHSMKFRIRATPAQNQTFISFNAKIAQDPSVGPDGDALCTSSRRRSTSRSLFIFRDLGSRSRWTSMKVVDK